MLVNAIYIKSKNKCFTKYGGATTTIKTTCCLFKMQILVHLSKSKESEFLQVGSGICI